MKSLNNYISEKLIINKTYKSCEYLCLPPKKSGTCLEVVIPYNNYENVITLFIQDYTYTDLENCVNVREGEHYFKGKDNYYCDNFKNHWVYVLLFNEDALLFLKKLAENPKEKINIKEIAKSIIGQNTTYEYVCKTNEYESYTIEKINNMISSIQ